MPQASGPKQTAKENLVFAFDTADVINSYKGEPTTNTVRYSNNVTGSNYGYNNEYETCQLVKTWIPNLSTPLGYGATQLTQQAVNSYLHCLNWFDSDEDGKRCLSAFIYPQTSGITNLFLGMVADGSNGVIFNLNTLAITYGEGITNRNAFINPVIGYPGWYRVGANIEGRAGGWVASFGIGQYQQYTPSAPFKSFYLCGLQYERGGPTHVTQPLPSLSGAATARSVTQGLLPLVGSTSIDLTNVSFDNNAQMIFDGTNDKINLGLLNITNTAFTYETIIKTDSITGGYSWILGKAGYNMGLNRYDNYLKFFLYDSSNNLYAAEGGTLNTTSYFHVVGVYTGLNLQLYVNGVLINTSGAISTPKNYDGTDTYVGTPNGSSLFYQGQIPVAKVYNRALTATEIQQNYKSYKTRFKLS
jgi:hypothetical protein